MSTVSLPLGCFSISLAVKNLDASRQFYAALGFTPMGGQPDHGWIILRNGNAIIGLFAGMFEKNMLTFNPGWDADGAPLPEFVDVREIQRRLRAAGLDVSPAADESSSGPAHLVVVDPDGNPVLIDQHV